MDPLGARLGTERTVLSLVSAWGAPNGGRILFFRGLVFEPRWCPCFFTAQQVRSFVVCVTEGESFFSRSSLRTSWVSVFFDSSTSSVVCRTCGVQHFVYSSIAAVSVLRLGVDEGVLQRLAPVKNVPKKMR